MSNKFRHKYRIPSARAAFHDYKGDAYFITICTAGMEHFFGEIRDSEMKYTEIGSFAAEQIGNITSHYPYAEIPLYVVMPNHIHLIVFVDNIPSCNRRDVACNVSVKSAKIHSKVAYNVHTEKNKNERMENISPKQGSLAVIIRGLKSAITRYANRQKIPFAWQTRYHDRIICDRHEMNRIAEYIENNPYNWTSDEYHTLR